MTPTLSKDYRRRGDAEAIHASYNQDENVLARLGYKQEFKRDFSPLELFGLGFAIIGVLPSIAAVLFYSVPYGGPVTMVWGWTVCSFFLAFIALAMAELGSSAPTSGGVYYWTYKFSSPRCRNYLCWIVGYTNAIAYISGVAGVDWGCAVQIMAAISIGTDGGFVPTIPQTYGVFIAIVITHAIIASLATKVIARMQLLFIVVNIGLSLAIIIGLPTGTPDEFKNTAKYAFGHFENLSIWPSGFAFILGFLAPLWVVGGFDATVHISEEARNANVAIPWAIISAAGISSLIGWGINVAIAFNMGTDLAGVVSNPIGQPLATILFNSFGKNGTLILWSFLILAQYMIGISILTSSSRQLFAFSRDGALPFSRFLYHMNIRQVVPIRCVWTSATMASLLCLICLAGPAATTAIFTMGVVGQYIANSIAISSRWLGPHEFIPGPFYLGSFWSGVSSTIAVCFMVFMTLVLLFPAEPSPMAATMNYTVLVFGGVLLLATIYYWTSGVYWFKGPVVTTDESRRGSSEGSIEQDIPEEKVESDSGKK